MGKSKNKKNIMNLNRFEWSRDPVEKVHSTEKGSRGYDRKKMNKKIKEEYILDLLEEEYIDLIKHKLK